MEHPLSDTYWRRIVFVTGVLVVVVIQTMLLSGYAGVAFPVAFADAFLSIGLLGALAYLSWFVVSYVEIRKVVFVTGVTFLLIWIAGCFAFQEIIMELSGTRYVSFLMTLPFRLLFAVPAWAAMMVWYRLETVYSEKEEENVLDPELSQEGTESAATVEEYIDRISVKDGTRIHLIRTEELYYIQACGDYVTLFTSGGQYVKEQTMKYFDANLSPEVFVRIHRSLIVNMTQISRVELFGKESYQLTLKSGTRLRVSLAGYRLLKERLGL